ncbi:MAG: rod shape-determining protein MreC [Candidatus Pacebacteria bacterium]|nr:rod shape-determining protein MreC [Candidatus Paceibacterota bacterium]
MKVRSRHNSKQRRTIRLVLFALLIIAVGMLLPRIMSAVAAIIMTPIHATGVWLEQSSSLVPTFFRDRRSLENEIESLEDRLAIAERTSLTQDRLWEENNRLRGLLGVASEERIAAAVIARPNELPYDLLQIDRGSNHGVTVGAPVFLGKDIVIGLVVHVAPAYSFVELITTPGFEASAFISGPNVVVTMEGLGGGVARVKVPQGIPIRAGDLVYLPSIEPGVYGRISYVENLPTQPEQYGYISPDISLQSVHQVAVGSLSQIARSALEVDQQVRELVEKSLFVEGVTVGSSTAASSTASTTIERPTW